MQKKLLTIFILVISILAFSGCADANYSVSIYDNGRIVETFYVELNQSAIELAGYNYQEVQNEILGKFEAVRNNLINSFNLSNNNLTILQKNQIRAGIRTPSIENNLIGVSFVFDEVEPYSGYEVYKLFYQIEDDGNDEDNATVEEFILFKKITTTSQTVFQNLENATLTTELLAYFSDPQNGNIDFTLNDVNFRYAYATSSTKLYSNADKVYKTSSGLKVHEWVVPSNNVNMEIEFYEYQIVSTWWYILALGLTVFFVFGVYGAHLFEVRSERKKGKTTTGQTEHNEQEKK
jgi:hypothetical protein